MCGIAGILYFDERPCEPTMLRGMSEAMRERGPDDAGEFTGPGIGLVHRRLSIIDLTAAGRCPMANEDGTVQVVLNGEIYNYRTLRDELQARGHKFRSHSDTETIVHGYEEWGSDVVHRLHGMFALAVWDAREQSLFVARDRAGEKPLYFAELPSAFAFASTLNAIVPALGATREVNTDAVACFLSHSFIPSTHTIWKRVRVMPPAHRAVVHRGGNTRVERYWNFPSRAPEALSVVEAEERIESALDSSVQARLTADVPVGSFLSGGVDSSLVTALAAKRHGRLATFSLGFAEREFSELPHARRVAAALGTDHHELVVTEDELLDVVPSLLWHYGQPFGDSSAIPTYLLSKFARQHVKVSLSGDGGDESFAGYWRATASWWAQNYSMVVPRRTRERHVPALVSLLSGAGLGSQAARLDAMNRLSLAAPGEGYTNSQSWLNLLEEVMPHNRPGSMRLEGHDPIRCRSGVSWANGSASPLQRLLYDDFQVLLPDDYLVKVDVASMAASLEVRAPLLDHHFLETAWLLPDEMKLRWGRRKWLLKRIAARHVPREVIYRPKQGFALPMARWWRQRLARVLVALLEDSRAGWMGWIVPAVARRCLDEHTAGIRDHSTRLWLVLCLELWARLATDGSMSRHDSLASVA